eukprot:gene10070-7040_t
MQTTEESLVEPRKQLSEIDARIKEYEEDLKACKEERVKAEAEVVAAKGRLGDAAAMRDTIRQQKQAQEAQLEALQSGAAEQERGRKKITDRIKKSTEDAQKAQLQQQDAEREAAIHESNLKEARETVTRLQEEHENLSSTLLPLLRPLRQKLEERRHDCAPFEEAVATAQEAVRSVKVKLSALEAAHAKSEGRLKELDEETARDRNRVEELRSNLKEAELAQQDEAQYRQLQEALLETSRRKYAINNVIQEKKSSVREGEADDRAVDFLLSQRSLKGYYGTLRQLGRIDEKYDIAAGVASNAWGFHVVEDRNTATAALTLLKNENVGRGSMMVVTEIDREMQHRMNAPFESPTPKATRLFDLIKPTNQKFRSAFYQAVRDTLVVSTLQEAREVAFNSRSGKRYRVVTLKGELVEPSGFITGGGGPPRGAKLKAARSPLDRQLIMEELKKQQAELQNAVEEERAIQLRLQELSQRRTSLTAREQKIIESELRRLMLKQEDFEKRRASVLEEVLETREAYEKKHKELLQTLQEYQAQEMEAQKEREKANASIEALEKEIEKTGGTTFSELTASLKKEQERVDLEEAALRTCRRSQEKWRAAHERRQADVAEYKEKLEKMEAEASEGVKEQVASCRITLEEIVRQLAKAETALAHEQQHTDSAKAAIPAIQSRILEAQKKVEEEMRYRQSEQSKMAHALQQLAKFEQKIEGCEQTIRNNVAQYGVETLELDPPEDSRQTEALNPDENGAAAEKDENRRSAEEDEECSDTTSDSDEEEKASRRRRRRKRPRAGTEAEGEAENGSQPGTKATLTEEEVLAIPLRLTPEKLATCDTNRCMHLANTLVAELDRLRQDIDLRAITLWWERNDAHLKAKEDYLRLKIESDRLDQELYDLKQQRRQSFMEVFVTIQAKIKEVYQMLTHGGDADLELVDANDPFEGVNFVVRPPRKPWRQIAYLSGGEKTLSSLALIFSLHHVKPTPVYVMDEIDAALDFRNVSIVANYVLGQATGAQFIIISLRNNMFELAHQLVGVCKVNDVTATLVLIPRAFQNRMRELCQSLMGKREMVETPGRKRRRSSGALASPTPSKEKLEGSRTAEEVVRNSYESGRGSVLSRASRKSRDALPALVRRNHFRLYYSIHTAIPNNLNIASSSPQNRISPYEHQQNQRIIRIYELDIVQRTLKESEELLRVVTLFNSSQLISGGVEVTNQPVAHFIFGCCSNVSPLDRGVSHRRGAAKDCRAVDDNSVWKHANGLFHRYPAGVMSNRAIWIEYDSERRKLAQFEEMQRQGSTVVLRDSVRDVELLLRRDVAAIKRNNPDNRASRGKQTRCWLKEAVRAGSYFFHVLRISCAVSRKGETQKLQKNNRIKMYAVVLLFHVYPVSLLIHCIIAVPFQETEKERGYLCRYAGGDWTLDIMFSSQKSWGSHAFRRCGPCTPSPSLRSTSSLLVARQPFMKGIWPGGKGSRTENTKKPSGASSFFPDLDPQKVSLVQEMLKKESPERQKELMEQALKFQQSMSKIPGFKKFAERQSKIVENLMKNTPPPSSFGTTPFQEAGHQRGPSLDELKRINLGEEIEGLFAELRLLRQKKNQYRDKYLAAKTDLEDTQKEKERVCKVEQSLRQKLQKAEQEVLLLNTEVMDLQDRIKKLTGLQKEYHQLKCSYDAIKSQTGDAVVTESSLYKGLMQELQHKEEMLQSLQRKLQRLRRNDPLLQFSLACSELERLSTPERVGAGRWEKVKAKQDEAFEVLQSQYRAMQAKAWTAACEDNSAGAMAFLTFSEHFLLTLLPHANLDACVTLSSESSEKEARLLFESKGFVVETVSSGTLGPLRLEVRSPPHGSLRGCGPYAYAVAAALCPPPTSSDPPPVLISSAAPCVTESLLQNEDRTVVHFDTARSSGPGGQAVNVSETQIHAKVEIDGAAVFSASAQDSRSAMQNKKAVMEKVEGPKRKQFNETLAGVSPQSAYNTALVKLTQTGGGVPNTVTAAAARDEAVDMVRHAVEAGQLSLIDVSLALSVQHIASGAATILAGRDTQAYLRLTPLQRRRYTNLTTSLTVVVVVVLRRDRNAKSLSLKCNVASLLSALSPLSFSLTSLFFYRCYTFVHWFFGITQLKGMTSSLPLYAAAVVRLSDCMELCLAPGVKLPDGRPFPQQLVDDIEQQYCKVPEFAVSDNRTVDGEAYSFHVMTDEELGFVILAGKSISRVKGLEALQEVSSLFRRMFVESPARLTTESTLTFVKPAHDLLIRLGAAPLEGTSGLNKVKRDIEEVKNIAIDNVNRAVQRGAKLDDIMEATDDLQFQAQGFHQNSRDVYNQIWWSSMKTKLLMGGAAFAFVLLILFTTGILMALHYSPGTPEERFDLITASKALQNKIFFFLHVFCFLFFFFSLFFMSRNRTTHIYINTSLYTIRDDAFKLSFSRSFYTLFTHIPGKLAPHLSFLAAHMPPKMKRKTSAGQRLDPLQGHGHPSRGGSRASSRTAPDRESSHGYSSHRSARSDAPLPPKPNSAGVGTRKPSANPRSSSMRPDPTRPPPHSGTKGKEKKGRMHDSDSQLFLPADKAAISGKQGPSKPPKVQRRGRDSDRDSAGHHRHAADESEPSPSPSPSSTCESASLNVSTRSEAHSRSKALMNGSPATTRGKLNLTPTKHGVPEKSGSAAVFSVPSGAKKASATSGSTGSMAEASSAKPSSTSTTSTTVTKKRENPIMTVSESRGEPPREGTSEPSRSGRSRSSKSRKQEPPLKDAAAVNHGDKSTWSKHISSASAKILAGRSLEPPFTTHLWKQAYPNPEDEEDDRDQYDSLCDGPCNPHIHQYNRKNRDGYYACIRCKAPICSPQFQVLNEERGIAAFQHINAEALNVEIDLTGSAIRGKRAPKFDTDAPCNIHFLAFCAYCHGCLGVCTMEIPAGMSDEVKSGELFYANSCCLTYMRYRTSANLKGVVVGGDAADGPLNDDLDDLLSNNDFGLDINDFDSDDGEGPRRPLVEFPSSDDELIPM